MGENWRGIIRAAYAVLYALCSMRYALCALRS
jgi:hypothetical protein